MMLKRLARNHSLVDVIARSSARAERRSNLAFNIFTDINRLALTAIRVFWKKLLCLQYGCWEILFHYVLGNPAVCFDAHNHKDIRADTFGMQALRMLCWDHPWHYQLTEKLSIVFHCAQPLTARALPCESRQSGPDGARDRGRFFDSRQKLW